MKIQVLDFETTINSEVHSGFAKDPINDFCTIIWGDHPNRINIVHNEEGFKRNLNIAEEAILEADLIIGHNLSFDLAYIIEYFKKEKRIPLCWDTSVCHYLLTGQRHSYPSLAELQEIYLGVKTKEDRISKLYGKGIGADHIIKARYSCPRLFKLYEKYCYQDGSSTLNIFSKQLEIVKKKGMLRIVQMYNKFMVTLVMMSSNGIHVDLTGTEKTIQEFKLKALELLTQANEVIKPYWSDERLPKFKVLSPTHKSALLFGGEIKCKVKRENGYFQNGNQKFKVVEELVYVPGFQLDLKYTKESKVDGRYVTDSEVINNIHDTTINAAAKEYCRLQLESMRYEKMISTYLKAFLKYSINGVLYPQFNNVAVITGRLSSASPNLQNIPSKGEYWEKIQGQFIAPKGWVCIAIDWSQLEMYIAAWNSGDEQLVKDLQNGLDFHCQSLAFAKQLDYDFIWNKCHKEDDPEYVLLRKKAKGITFQKEYGAGIKTVAKDTGLSEELVSQVFEALDNKYWKLKMFKEHVLETARNNMQPSNMKYLPTKQRKGGKNGRRFTVHGYELLPVECGNTRYYDNELLRNVGYYQTNYGKIYSFEEYAALDKNGNIRRNLSVPQTKNYTSQGGAADVVAACSIDVQEYCLQYKESIKYVSQIHDSYWLYVKEKEISRHVPIICDIMENVPKSLKKHLNVDLDIPFKVEVTIGTNFAEMTTWERQCV